MGAVLIGGLDRLQIAYIETAKSLGVTLKVFNGQERNIEKQFGTADILILCTGKVSHNARREAIKYAREKQILVRMMHSAGVSALCYCIEDCPLGHTCSETSRNKERVSICQMTMRWVGSGCDLVTLEQIRQVPGVSGVITALHGVPVGIVWETAHIRALQIEKMEAHNAPY